jgi:hypothetical protein
MFDDVSLQLGPAFPLIEDACAMGANRDKPFVSPGISQECTGGGRGLLAFAFVSADSGLDFTHSADHSSGGGEFFMKRVFLAGVLGGVAMFIWSSIAHMALPLGEAGIRELPNERAVLDAMQGNIAQQRGLYIFPGFGLGPNPTHEQKTEAMKQIGENLARHPSGILMYHPAGSRPLMMVRWLWVEFATELLEALLVVFLLSQTRLTSFGERVGFLVVAGMLVAIATNISY